MVSTARLGVVKQNSFGLPGQYGRRVTRANVVKSPVLNLLALITIQLLAIKDRYIPGWQRRQ